MQMALVRRWVDRRRDWRARAQCAPGGGATVEVNKQCPAGYAHARCNTGRGGANAGTPPDRRKRFCLTTTTDLELARRRTCEGAMAG